MVIKSPKQSIICEFSRIREIKNQKEQEKAPGDKYKDKKTSQILFLFFYCVMYFLIMYLPVVINQ